MSLGNAGRMGAWRAVAPLVALLAVPTTAAAADVEGALDGLVPGDTVIASKDCDKPAVTVPAGSGAVTIEGLTIVSSCPAGTQVGIAIHGPSSPQISGNRLEGFSTAIAVGLPGDAGSATPVIASNTITGVHGAPILSPGVGIDIGHGANPMLRGNTISAPGPGESIGVRIRQEASTVAGTTGADLEGNRITGHTMGLVAEDPGTPVTLFNDLIAHSGRAGLRIVDSTPLSNDAEAQVQATNINIVETTVPGPEVELAGGRVALDSAVIGGGGIANVSPAGACEISYSRGPAGAPVLGGCGDFQVNADPGFADPGQGNYVPKADSPLVDAGNPGPSNVLTDLVGNPRQLDGNGDCEQRRDIGAVERAGGNPCLASRTAGASALPVFVAATATTQRGLEQRFHISSAQKLGNYILCVVGPRSKCRSFKSRRKKGRSTDTVFWSKEFRYGGPGHYTVSWHAFRGGPALGPQQTFEWGPCAPRRLSMAGVWRPSRLIIRSRCYTGEFIVNSSFRVRNDRDIHIRVNPIGSTHFSFKNLEIIPRDRNVLPRPANGRRIRATGVFVCDTFHGPFGHTEIHPIFREEYLNDKGEVVSTHTGGPQRRGTPRVNLRPRGRFHCR